MIFGRRIAHVVSDSCRELEVKAILCVTENRSVEPVVVDELGKHHETQTLRVHRGNRRQVISRPSDAQSQTGLHGLDV